MTKRASFRRGLVNQARSLNALMVRDLLSRYGRDNLGFLWLIAEPMILTVGVMIVWSYMPGHNHRDLNIIGFVLTGYMSLTLWRHMTNGSLRIVRANVGLLYHRRISILDLLLARQCLAFLGASIAFVVVYIAIVVTGMSEPIKDPSKFLVGWVLLGFLSIGVAALLAVLTSTWEVAEHFVPPVQYLILPITGAFFLLDWMPPEYRRYLEYVPIIHGFELVRGGFFGDSIKTYGDPKYLAIWGVVVNAIGLLWLHRVKDFTEL